MGKKIDVLPLAKLLFIDILHRLKANGFCNTGVDSKAEALTNIYSHTR